VKEDKLIHVPLQLPHHEIFHKVSSYITDTNAATSRSNSEYKCGHYLQLEGRQVTLKTMFHNTGHYAN
jgi:hypothetical protein